jgi:hypothetical protein
MPPKYARCNFDGKPVHPNDQRVLDTFAIWLEMDEIDRILAVNLDPQWRRFVLGEELE